MHIVICPGIHSPVLTEQFIQALPHQSAPVLIVPTDYPPYSGVHILAFLLQQLGVSLSFDQLHLVDPHACDQFQAQIRSAIQTPVLFIGFSAGVVGAIAAAYLWQSLGGQVKALVALDGWGVPLFASFPIYRVSHDWFTHWSSALFGAGQDSFYADPAVAHLDLWGALATVQGWWVQPTQQTQTTAAHFLTQLLQQHGIER